MRECNRCKRTQPMIEFYCDPHGIEGRSRTCRTCRRPKIDVALKRRRVEMGEEKWLAQNRQRVAASRAKPG